MQMHLYLNVQNRKIVHNKAMFYKSQSILGFKKSMVNIRKMEKLNSLQKKNMIGVQVLILKLNKEAPLRKDVFRAPGHQGNMKKLIHFLQTGRLVNIDTFSVYTIASVLKKFLRKIPGGVFGREGEQQLFTVIQLDSVEQQRDQIHK